MRNNNTRLFVLLFTGAHFFHHLVSSMLVPLLPLIRDQYGLSYAQAGGIVSAFTLSYGISQLPAGWIADRIGAKYLFLAGISGVAVAGALIGLSSGTAGLIVLLILMGILAGGYHPSAAPLISASVPPAQKGKALGFHIIGGSGSHFISPLLAVFVAGFLGWRGAYLITSLPVFLFGLWFFFILIKRGISAVPIKPSPSQEEGAGPSGSPARPGFGYIVLFLCVTSVISAVIGSSMSFIPLFLVDSFGIDQRLAALFLSLYYMVGIFAAPVGGVLADRFNPGRIFMVLALVSGPALILFGWSPSWMFLGLMIVLIGVIGFFRMTLSETFFITSLPRNKQSTILGIYFFAGMEGSGIITPILGRAIDSWGFSYAYSVLGFVLLGTALIYLGMKKYLIPAKLVN